MRHFVIASELTDAHPYIPAFLVNQKYPLYGMPQTFEMAQLRTFAVSLYA